jgi:hypothetical protein
MDGAECFPIFLRIAISWLGVAALCPGLSACALGASLFLMVSAWVNGQTDRLGKHHFVLYAPFLIPAIMVLLGTVFSEEIWPENPYVSVGCVLICLLFLSHLPITSWLLERFSRSYLFVFGLSLLQAWVSFCVGAVCLMTITGSGP